MKGSRGQVHARQLFVAVHAERITVFARDKSYSAHGSICRRISGRERGIITPLAPATRNAHRRAAAPAVFRADGENQIPLPEQRAIRVEQRIPRVINARSFRRRAVQLDDLEIFSGAQIGFARIAEVVAADVKTGELL